MRYALALILCLLPMLSLGQGEDLPLSMRVRADVTIVVTKHAMGPDLVTITADRPEYPQEVLRQNAERLAAELGTELRGLDVFRYEMVPGDARMIFTRATFAVDGLVRRDEGRLGLQEIARAFAQQPDEHPVRGLTVQYQSEAPNQQTVRTYTSDAVEVEGSADPGKGLEYRILLKTNDPALIVIPEGQEAQEAVQPKAPERSLDWLTISLIVAAALALGALVYSLLLRTRPTAGSK
jgi:hypothetical protein